MLLNSSELFFGFTSIISSTILSLLELADVVNSSSAEQFNVVVFCLPDICLLLFTCLIIFIKYGTILFVSFAWAVGLLSSLT